MKSTRTELLLAEDDPGHAKLITKALRDAGFTCPVRHFPDGQAILDFLEPRPGAAEGLDPACRYMLLLDIRMPKISGDEVLRRIKENPRLRLMPVIMLTTTEDPREVKRCHELGCSEYVIKPIDYKAFNEVLRRLAQFLQVVHVPPLVA